MNVELINTGSELMLGFVLNTHQQWLCRELSALGHIVSRQTAVPDTADAIEQAVREALTRADVVITTGGLGPTSDDITRDRIAALLGMPLKEDSAIVGHIEKFFAERHRAMPPSTRVQALVPEGATVLANADGTAPGLALDVPAGRFRAESRPGLLIMLPGPPRELRPMFTNQVVPLLRTKLPQAEDFVCRVLKTTGLGESLVEERIAGPLQKLVEAGMELGYCARVGEVDVRLSARGPGAERLVKEGVEIVGRLLGKLVFSTNDEALEQAIIRLMTEKGRTLALAESCTGGLVANRITNVPGASAVLVAGLVAYSNEAKQILLGVRPETLAAHGAVSEATAREMAGGARSRTGADYGIAITGIAGPGGGTLQKPVGTVFIALAGTDETKVVKNMNRWDRETFKYVTSQQALDLLRQAVLNEGERLKPEFRSSTTNAHK